MAKDRKTETTTAHLEPLRELTPIEGEIVERRLPALPDYPDYRLPAPVPYGNTLVARLRYHGMTEALIACERLMQQATKLNEAAEIFTRSSIAYERQRNRFDQLDAILADDRDALELQLWRNKLERRAALADYLQEETEQKRKALPAPSSMSSAEVYAETLKEYLSEAATFTKLAAEMRKEFEGVVDEKVIEDFDQLVKNTFNFLKNHNKFSRQPPPSDTPDNITPLKRRRRDSDVH